MRSVATKKSGDAGVKTTITTIVKNILIGNGFSISISNSFSYHGLREKVDEQVNPAVDRLFNKLKSDDFELLLSKVSDAKDVIEALTDGQIIVSDSISAEIRKRLILAVQSIHPISPINDMLDPQAVNKVLQDYNDIFTTNYDLYSYWCRLGDEGFNIVDFFFKNHTFDRNNVEKRGRLAMYFFYMELYLFSKNPIKLLKLTKENSQHFLMLSNMK